MSETKAPDKMTARQALAAYGFVRREDDTWVRLGPVPTQMWRPTHGGWLRIDPPRAPLAALEPGQEALPWGKPLPDTDWVQVPFRQTEEFADASGLHPAKHPQCFDFVWPDEAVAEIYAYGHTPEYGQQWRRNEDGELVPDPPKDRQERGDS